MRRHTCRDNFILVFSGLDYCRACDERDEYQQEAAQEAKAEADAERLDEEKGVEG